jgi:hypothetical protein
MNFGKVGLFCLGWRSICRFTVTLLGLHLRRPMISLLIGVGVLFLAVIAGAIDPWPPPFHGTPHE